MATRWTRRTHEVHAKVQLPKDLRQFFDMPKILWRLPKLLPNPKRLSRRTHDGLGCIPEWPDVFTIIPDVANFLHRVSIGSQNRDSVTPALVKKKIPAQSYIPAPPPPTNIKWTMPKLWCLKLSIIVLILLKAHFKCFESIISLLLLRTWNKAESFHIGQQRENHFTNSKYYIYTFFKPFLSKIRQTIVIATSTSSFVVPFVNAQFWLFSVFLPMFGKWNLMMS